MIQDNRVNNRRRLPLGSDFRLGSLRSLAEGDAPLMLEWMHDSNVSSYLAAPFDTLGLEDCTRFIESSRVDETSIHLAIVDGDDEYIGTVSLKNVDFENGRAEYAIATRTKAHGTGAAAVATQDILRVAFDVLGLNSVFLDVRQDNPRAIRFYEKIGFTLEGRARQAMCVDGEYVDLLWLSMLASEFKARG